MEGKEERGLLDAAAAVRAGEEVDADRLLGFLAARAPETFAAVDALVVEQFPGGYSNLTYLLRAPDGREWVLRRPPRGAAIATAHDMAREHRVLAALSAVWDKAPRPVADCADAEVIGSPFYVMERVRGVVLRREIPAGLSLDAETMRRVSETAVDTLAEIHGVDLAATGLGDLGRAEGYVERQVAGWGKRWAAVRTDDVPEVERLVAWLDARRPRGEAVPPTLLHNDFKYDNLVLDVGDLGRVRAVLDWEMATVGDARMDLGTALGYWVDAADPPEWRAQAFVLTHLPGNLGRAEVVERYVKRSGREPGDIVFCYAFALFKLAVIGQQIYARYRRGLTSDPRFAALPGAVRACGWMAGRAIDRGRVDRLG